MIDDEIKYYYPVLIPTLCRFEHFKRCIETLNACTGADFTDVYVGLDYPTKDAHKAGWEKIQNFLKEFNPRFRSFVVFERERNYGFGPNGNSATLINYCCGKYKGYIVSEDDNEFSPNFLVYMNSCLHRYENNADVLHVCGYNVNAIFPKTMPNIYASYEFSAWGYGTWFSKSNLIHEHNNLAYYHNLMSSWSNIWQIYKREPRLLNTLLYLIVELKRTFGDTTRVCYQLLNNKQSIFPTISKVRNHGFDGTGTTIEKLNNSFALQLIDTNSNFTREELTESGNSLAERVIHKYHSRAWWFNIAILIRVAIYYLFKFDFVTLIPKSFQKKLLH